MNLLKPNFILIILWIYILSVNAQPPQRPVIVSPQVHDDNSVTFKYYAPKASEVKLSGQFLSGPVSMTKDDQGVWVYQTTSVKPDMYPYSFIVDGTNVADPNNTMIFPNEGFQASVVEITGIEPLVHTLTNVAHGTVSYRYYQSKELGIRPLVVYTPPGYEQNLQKYYPVLYLLHGTTDTEETWTKVGRAHLISDNLLAEAKSKPMIIVMPYGRAFPLISKSSGSLRNWENLQEFKKDFYGNLMPFIENNYRTINNKDNRAIAGFSGGGGTALYLGFNDTEKFAYVCGFAPGMLKNEFDRNNEIAFKDPLKTNTNLKLFWIGIGKEDMLYNVNQEFMQVLDQKKIKYEKVITDGGHTWMNVKNYLSLILPKLF